MITVREIAAIAGMAIVAVLLFSAVTYRHLYHSAADELRALRDDVQRKNAEATRKLADLTAQRDRRQIELNHAAAEQERKDDHAQAEIARLTDELRARPVRVRIIPGGGCGGGAASHPATAAEAGTGNSGPAYGLLPHENSQRLADAIAEVETLSAAYASCRDSLLNPHKM